MIDEDELRRLLADAAEAVPPPGRAPEELVAGLAEPPPAPPRLPPRRVRVLAAAAVLLGLIAAATLVGRSGGSSRDSSTDATSATAVAGGAPLGVDKDPGRITGATTPATGGGAGRGSVVAPAPPTDSAKVIKTGSLDLQVRKGAFEGVVDRVTAKTIGLGGYIAESTTSQSSDAPSGTIAVRVPAGSYEGLLTELRKLGDVKSVTSKGTDVTAELTDLAARLAALVATRDRLSTVLSEANTVGDILAVQDRITNVQVEIERIQGQQRLLDDQTAFATLAVTLAEPGGQIRSTEPDRGLGQAWDDARRRFGDGVESLVSWSGPAALALLVAFVALVVTRLAWIGLRRRAV